MPSSADPYTPHVEKYVECLRTERGLPLWNVDAFNFTF